ncbi:hypothetical protein D2E25_1084 [Bifidobacterium goeldii]|uniref:Uncharacterized protein n=1 Tax=Bifidobacterium goeldii TaxID=2306975 RepID=A0A430FK41_9BIFI|nr:hypothetical protein D2E25_1084 [Bifidobacterium goeldii]
MTMWTPPENNDDGDAISIASFRWGRIIFCNKNVRSVFPPVRADWGIGGQY